MVALSLPMLPLVVSLAAASASLCGEKTCNSDEYCSEDTFCVKCEGICLPSDHNYDEATCKLKCPEYNMNQFYVPRSEFDAAIKGVHIYIVISLLISILVLLLVLGAFLTVWMKYRRLRNYSNSTEKSIKKKKMESIKAICVNEVDGPKKLKLEMPVVPPPVDNTPPSAMTTMTPLSRRYPSEDATLEYAYDNPTLTHSPVLNKGTPDTTPRTTRTETSF